MALRCEIQEFLVASSDAVNTTFSRTWGFTPQAIRVIASGVAAQNTASATHANPSFGLAVSPTDRVCYSGQSEDGSPDSDTDRGNSRSCVVREHAHTGTSGGETGALDISSWSGTNITFIVDVQFDANMWVTVVAYGGFDNVALAHFNDRNTGTSGTHDVTVSGFGDVDAVICAGIMLATAPDTNTTQLSLSIGYASWNGSAWEQFVCAIRDEQNVPNMNTFSYLKSGELGITFNSAGTDCLVRFSADSRITDGVRLNYTECDAPATGRVNSMLFFQGGSHKTGLITTLTNTSSQIPIDTAFEPVGGDFASHCNTESTADTPQAHLQLSLGSFDENAAQAAHMVFSEDGPTTSDTSVATSSTELYINPTDTGAGAVEGRMKLDTGGIRIDGADLIMTDADPAGKVVGYWLFGDPTGATGSGTPSIAVVTASGSGIASHKGTGAPSIAVVIASGVGNDPPRGQGAPSIAVVTASGSGVSAHKGSGSTSTAVVTASGVGTDRPRGTGTPSISAVTSSGSGVSAHVGSGVPSIAVAIASGVGVSSHRGTGSLSIASATASGVGVNPPRGQGTPSVASVVANGSGVSSHRGSGTPSVAAITALGSGIASHKGTGTPLIAIATASGEGTRTAGGSAPTGSGSPSTAVTTASGSGTSSHHGNGAPSTAVINVSGAGRVAPRGSGTPSFGVSTASGSGISSHPGSGDLAIALAVAAGSGRVGPKGLGAISIAIATAIGVGQRGHTTSAALVIASITCSGIGTVNDTGQMLFGFQNNSLSPLKMTEISTAPFSVSDQSLSPFTVKDISDGT